MMTTRGDIWLVMYTWASEDFDDEAAQLIRAFATRAEAESFAADIERRWLQVKFDPADDENFDDEMDTAVDRASRFLEENLGFDEWESEYTIDMIGQSLDLKVRSVPFGPVAREEATS